MEGNNELEPRISALEEDLDDVDDSEEEDVKESRPKPTPDKYRGYRDLDRPFRPSSPKFRRSRSPHKR